ncbi:hypothetical protein C8A01DRAFT_14637 [Parachaetomium inaequale]|uniref:WW domain-containing protein n=1 Tax=Parachaetomium inaequale TaxID=2588326 RepID=A0AAN6PJ40_9PEZI|nr:hypothetical protein C8A01DRAFT_14637 [Parachaetomium inaequale]
MAALPENWEWDYDGTRWFYRYKPTGLIQYTFPKPGDEFPEFVDDSAVAPDLAPEEKLVSQQQIKRRSTLGESQSKQTTTAARRDRAPSNAVSDPDDGGTPFWLQPDGLMYMGPGAYNDISPLQEEEEERGQDGGQDEGKADEADIPDGAVPAPTGAAATSTTATATPEVTPDGGTTQPTRTQISPVASVETTPLVINSSPAITTPELDSGVVIGTSEPAPVDAVVEPPEIPLLDSRQVPYNPIGFVAELASEFTARCEEEINPAPVEMPSNEIMMDTSEPADYTKAFDFAPVELPSNEARPAPNPVGHAVEQKLLASQTPREQEREQQRRAHQAVQELLNRPYRPVRQNSLPQSSQASNATPDPTPGKYQPYNPAKHAVLGAAAANRYSTIEPPSRQPVGDNKRHSLAGPALAQFHPSNVPPALQPAHVQPLDSSNDGAQTTPPNSRPRPDSISGPSTVNPGGLAHFPSVLQPARGRPVIRTQTPPQSQGASPARTYQAYKPYRDLQRDIEDTVQLLSKTGYGQGTTANPEASNSGRPPVSRTSTLPAHLPALPYMGVRPHLPPSATTEPVTLRNLQSHQTPSGESSTGILSGGEPRIAMPQDYSAPLPPSSSDVPQPLNLSRKSPSPPNSAPTSSAFRPPVPAKPDIIPWETTSAPSSTVVVSATPMVSSVVEMDSHQGLLGSADKTGRNAEQTGATVQPNHPSASSRPHQSSPGPQQDTNQMTTSSGLPRLARRTSPEQAVWSGFNTVESTIQPAPQVAASTQPPAVKPEASNQPVAATSFSVDVTDVPPVLANTRDAPTLSESAPMAHSGTPSGPALAGVQEIIVDRLPEPSTTAAVVQSASQSVSSLPDLAASGDAPSSSYASSDYQPVVQVHHQHPPQPNTALSADQTVEAQASHLPAASPAPPATSQHQPSNPVQGLDGQQAVSPPPPSTTPRPPSPRTPSPVSRASSPPTRASVTQSIPSVTPPVPVTISSPQTLAITDQTPHGQNGIQGPVLGHGTSTMASSSPPTNTMPMASSIAPVYTLPSGHHPLASHPVNVPQPSPPGPERYASTQTATVAPPQAPAVAQNNVGHPQSTGAFSQQQPPHAASVPMPSQPPAQNLNPSQGVPKPASPPSLVQQGTASFSVPRPNQGQTASHQTGPQAPPAGGQSQFPMQHQMPPTALTQGQAAAKPSGSNQAPPNMPLRTFSHPVVSQSGPPPHPGAPGTAPPQLPMMFAPPAIPPGMPPQGFQPGMLPQQQYAFQPNRLQKATQQPQVPLVFPPPLHPNQPVPAPQFAPPGTQMPPPHMMMMRPQQQPHQQQGQQQQHPQQPMQFQQQQQQQQQQSLKWKTDNGASGNQNPQFPAPNRNNPNQQPPVITPPEVLQAIKQQEQRLAQAGPVHVQGQVHAAQNGNGGQSGAHPAGGGLSQGKGGENKAVAAVAGGWGKANASSSSGYDGSGWGDDDDEGGY